jgi:hypothetical protein
VDKIAEEPRALSARDDDYLFFGGLLEMTRPWSYFIGAVVVTGYLLISHGAPPAAVAAGAAGAAILFWRRGSVSRLP